MRIRPVTLVLAICWLALYSTTAAAQQTLVFFRHGEKPSGGYGQLTCQGLNRAFALTDVLTAKFGKPDLLYSANPSVKIGDAAGSFYYVRPLATIEPTAVKLRLPVSTRYMHNDVAGVTAALVTPTKAATTIFISWEHDYLVQIVQNIMNRYGHRARVPAWTSGDYDSLYVVRLDYVGGTITARFEREREGLNGQPTTCPF